MLILTLTRLLVQNLVKIFTKVIDKADKGKKIVNNIQIF